MGFLRALGALWSVKRPTYSPLCPPATCCPAPQVYNSQDVKYGGWEGLKDNSGEIKHSHDGRLWLNLPGQCTLVFRQVYEV